ncbi:MAG: thiamine-phosphate diphosphorylase [Nitrospirae bacterium CG1_02_44_142]|nr:MAG: thiamine-phosphate diphosphorylase [Nitrospirae bacterium CG1_02_44_142]
MKRDELIDFKLYLITDRKLVTHYASLITAVEEALKGGVKALQLREKDLGTRELLALAYKMREITNKYKAKLFINDRVDVALAVKADGVHLGQNSVSPHAERKAVNASRITHYASRFLIGVSAHSIEEAEQAEKEGADFITLGPVYKTPSKLKYGKPLGVDIIRKAKAEISIPVFAIGGIKTDMVKEVMDAGADGIALISGILGTKKIKGETEKYLSFLRLKCHCEGEARGNLR